MSLIKLISDGRIHPARIEDVVKKVEQEVDVTIKEAGEQAAFDLGVHGIHNELGHVLRAAEIQNQLCAKTSCSILLRWGSYVERWLPNWGLKSEACQTNGICCMTLEKLLTMKWKDLMR